MRLFLAFAVLTASVAARPALAGGIDPFDQNGASAAAPAGGPAPIRSADGRLTITAVEAPSGVTIDGALTDEVWLRAQPIGDFVQSEPAEGQPATQPTEVRMAFDRSNLYIAAFLHDRDRDSLIVTDIRKDFGTDDQDTFEVIIDTFGDRTNGFVFATNPEGARSDQQVTNEGREVNASWDAVWNVKTRKLDEGWTVEMAIPFRSLRFAGGIEKVWGINFCRRIRRVNEVTYWSIVPRQFKISRVSLAGNLEGLPARSPSRNLRIKPYLLGSAVRATGGEAFGRDGELGVDIKYGVTSSLTFDLTINPDFAQAEADQQQVNLTQFSQFYPEKRDFFLENSGVFYVGDASRTLVGNSATTSARADTDLYYFFSRRIGLTPGGEPIPIVGGARLTGQAAGLNVGVMTIQTQDTATTPRNHYTVARLRRAAYRNNAFFGGIFMQRQNTDRSGDYNRVIGLDANIRLFGRIDTSASYFDTYTPGITKDKSSYRVSYLFEGRKYYTTGTIVSIGKDFNDELGYYRRVGIRKWILDSGMRPRPKALQKYGIRELQPHFNWDYFTDMSGNYFARNLHTGFSVYANNGSFVELAYNPGGDTLARETRIAGMTVPAGVYRWANTRVRYASDPTRLVSGSINLTHGTLWIGDERSVNADVTIKPNYRFRTTLSMQRTSIEVDPSLPKAVALIVSSRTNYSFTTNMFIDSLIQYEKNRHQVNSNIRFNFIHHPLSDFYIVYNDQRFTTDGALVPGRGLIVKFTQMFSF